jgi:hypothetical protein
MQLHIPREIECFKHYCRACHAMHFVPRTSGAEAEYPKCCGKHMAYLGIVTARPGRDESLKRTV